MSDQRLRELERQARKTRDPEAVAIAVSAIERAHGEGAAAWFLDELTGRTASRLDRALRRLLDIANDRVASHRQLSTAALRRCASEALHSQRRRCGPATLSWSWEAGIGDRPARPQDHRGELTTYGMAVMVKEADAEFVTFGFEHGVGVVAIEGGFVGPNPTLAWESLDVPYLVEGSRRSSEECRALAWARPPVPAGRFMPEAAGVLPWKDPTHGDRITVETDTVRRWLLLHEEGMFDRAARPNPIPSPTDGHFLETVDSAIEWALEYVGNAEQDYPPGNSRYAQELRDKKEEEVAEYVDQFHEAMRSDRVRIWRCLEIPAGEDPMDAIDWENLGVYWSFHEHGAGVYAGHLDGPTDRVTVAAAVMPADIDWERGFSSFWYYGTEQFECALKPGAEIKVLKVEDAAKDLEARANPIRVKRRPKQQDVRRNMHLSLTPTLSHELICTLCERPMSNHASSCPERLAESIQASRLLWRCPRCFEDVERNMDDFLECRGCATVYSTSGSGPAAEALMPVSPGTDLEPVVVLKEKGRGQFDYDRKMAEVAAMRRRVEAGRKRSPSQEALERRWRATQERERREAEIADDELALVEEITEDCAACDRVRKSGVAACRRHAREIRERKSGWNPTPEGPAVP